MHPAHMNIESSDLPAHMNIEFSDLLAHMNEINTHEPNLETTIKHVRIPEAPRFGYKGFVLMLCEKFSNHVFLFVHS